MSRQFQIRRLMLLMGSADSISDEDQTWNHWYLSGTEQQIPEPRDDCDGGRGWIAALQAVKACSSEVDYPFA